VPARKRRVTDAYNPVMPLSWFSGSKEASLDELVAAKKYKQAIELLRQQFKAGSRDPRLRLQLADVLVLAGRAKEATPILSGLADEYARAGFAAKAIAVLKKLQKAAPGNPDVERRMAKLLHAKLADSGAGTIPPTRAASDSSVSFGMEEIGADGPGEIGIGDAFLPVSTPSAPSSPPPAAKAPAAAAPAAAAAPLPAAEELLAGEPIVEPAGSIVETDEFFGLLDDMVDGVAVGVEATAADAAAAAVPATPQNAFLSAFSEAELQAVIHRFQLLSFAPGDIVVSEGQPGNSLFVLTTGTLKTFVRDQSGRNVALRDLEEGSFFGEVGVLTGKPRSATITCASACELLELDRAAFDEIVAQYPRVRDLIRATYESRAGSLEEMLAREGWDGETKSKPS
jgi:CRP-like cAMP-binding protein